MKVIESRYIMTKDIEKLSDGSTDHRKCNILWLVNFKLTHICGHTLISGRLTLDDGLWALDDGL